ncbi:MAG: cyclohex-ene-carbonyl-CoA dehydrogenase [Thermodesulfobacteriota bacterium]|nr:cyclohex-ene-carbonyl-CoA dehydrogenase [Thermodesulfobacteriota bacterium]
MITLDIEQKIILGTVRKIVQETIRPRAAEIDDRAEFPWDTVRVFSENGVLAPLLPEPYGGIGLPYLTFSMVLEEIAKACASSALILIAQADGMLPILCAGSESLKERVLPPLAKGRLAAFAATEPGAGSDILSMNTRAVRRGDAYVLNGQKCFITNGSIADVVTVYAFTDPEKRSKGITAFAVEKGTPGFLYGKNENKMGMRGCVNSQLFFEDMEIPAENVIGEEGKGIGSMMAALDTSRLFSASQAVGLAQGAIDEAVAYARGRVQFGQPIADMQAIQFMIADMAAGTEAARLLTYQAACRLDRKEKKFGPLSCAMAKFFASDNAMKVTTDAVQVMGGYGYMKDYPVERMMRDAKLIQIYTGTNQIMRLVTARGIFRN